MPGFAAVASEDPVVDITEMFGHQKSKTSPVRKTPARNADFTPKNTLEEIITLLLFIWIKQESNTIAKLSIDIFLFIGSCALTFKTAEQEIEFSNDITVVTKPF